MLLPLLLIAFLLGILCITNGFFSLQDIQQVQSQNSTNFNVQPVVRTPLYDKLVLVVIDALRSDMVYENTQDRAPLSKFMPKLSKLIQDQQVQGYVGHATIPTGL